MSLALEQSFSAVGLNITSSFLGVGGTAPYVYSIRPNGVGGTINASSGLYTAPAALPFNDQPIGYDIARPYNPAQLYDTIVVTDNTGAQATAQIFVGSPILLFCDVLQNFLQLAPGHMYLWNQKLFQPKDATMYAAVKMFRGKPFANTQKINSDGSVTQSINMYADLQVSAISRNHEARDRCQEVVMASQSQYAEQQMEANSFSISRLNPGAQFICVSEADGAAIPYRFDIMMSIQYFVVKSYPGNYFNTFQTPTVTTEP